MGAMSMVQELEQLRLGAKSWKSEIDALARVNSELKEKLVAGEQAVAALVESHKVEIAKMAESVKVASESLEASQKESEAFKAKVADLEAKMQLVPVADAVAGQAPVADGGSAPEPKVEIDHYAEWRKLDGIEAAQYYKQHQIEIDAQFSK